MILIADSGSTKADWKIIMPSGDIQFQSTNGFNPFFQDSETIETTLRKQFTDELKKDEATEVYYYGAGCSDDIRCEIVAVALRKLFPNAEIHVNHDLLAAARALCGDQPGIACILGTGSNSCLYDGKEVIDNVDNMGSFVGDEGSGMHIGKELLKGYFYREMPEELIPIFEEFCSDGKQGILSNIYDNDTPNVYLASFSRFMSENRDYLYIQRIVFNCFEEFIKRHVQKYEGHTKLDIHFVGSVAFYFRDILNLVLEMKSLTLGNIIKQPIDSLMLYHQTKIKA